MAKLQLEVASTIVALAAYRSPNLHSAAGRLNSRDKLEVNAWRETARLAGFDRLVIHERDQHDASEVGDFLSIYRRNEAWSKWGVARRGALIKAWCSLSWADFGEFPTLSAALQSLLGVAAPIEACASLRLSPILASTVVTKLRPRHQPCESRLGSAA